MGNDSISFDKTFAPGAPDVGRGIPASASSGTGRSPTLNPGNTLGQYKIVRLLGRGGMGEVYEVEHEVFRRRYALKLLPADFASRPGALERFKRDIRAMANLDHPNIVKVDECGQTDARHWLRMELAEGVAGSELGARSAEAEGEVCVRSLAEYAQAKGGRLDPDQAEVVFTHILEGLAHAHASGVVHRDLKPANVLICSDADGVATFKISDFGLVRMVGEDWVLSQADQSIRLSMSMGASLGDLPTEMSSGAGTSTRSLIGTYEYMSPEQKRGQEATTASDVYAVGLMMYRLLTGRQLGMKRPSELVPELPSWWDDLIGKAVEGEAGDRFADASAMLAAFKGVASRKSPPPVPMSDASPPAAFEPPPPSLRTETPRAGQPWTSPSTGMEFVWIAAVNAWVGKYEVTNGEYRKKEREHDSKEFRGHSLNGDRQPVVRVNFDDAKGYAKWLTEEDWAALGGARYRLPTETEWLKFAQCGDGREYPWGNEWPPPSGRAGNYHGQEGAGTWSKISGYNDGFPVTAEVDKLWRNPWGLYGVGGNVWEACASNDAADQTWSSWRGASWNDGIKCVLRCSVCDFDASGMRYHYGFRVLLSRPP